MPRLQAEYRRRAAVYEGRALRRALGIHKRAAQRQAVRRQAKAVIYQRELAPQLPVSGSAKVYVQLKQALPLLVGEYSGVAGRGGQALVAHAEDDEVLYISAAHTVKITGGHSVERHGYHAHIVAREHQREQPPEAFHVHLRVAEYRGALLKRGDDDIPQLRVLARKTLPSRGHKLLRALAQALGELQLLEKVRQRRRLLRRGGRFAAMCGKMQQRVAQCIAQGVYFFQALRGLLGVLGVVAVRMLPPVARAAPRSGAELPLKDIVFKRVAVLRRKSGQARAHIAYHVVNFPAAAHDVIRCGYHRGERLRQQVAAPRHEKRHAVMLERALQRRAVFVKAAHRDRDIAPAAAAVAHKGYRLRRRELTFGHHAVRRHELHRIVRLALKAHGGVAEHILGEEIERVAADSRREMPRLRFRAKFPRIGEQLARAAAGQLEYLVLAVQLIHRQAYGELHAALQKRTQHLSLLKREIYESVDIYMVIRPHGAVEYLPGKHGQPVGGVGVSVRYDGVVGFEYQRHVRELVPKSA